MSQTDKKDKIKKALERVKLSDFALEGFDKELYQKERLCKLDESFMNKKASEGIVECVVGSVCRQRLLMSRFLSSAEF